MEELEIDYKQKYYELKEKHDLLKKKVNSRKDDLVDGIYKKLKIVQGEVEIATTYGYFFWKLSIDELIYLDKVIGGVTND